MAYSSSNLTSNIKEKLSATGSSIYKMFSELPVQASNLATGIKDTTTNAVSSLTNTPTNPASAQSTASSYVSSQHVATTGGKHINRKKHKSKSRKHKMNKSKSKKNKSKQNRKSRNRKYRK